MKKIAGYFSFFLVVYLFFVISQLPAQFIVSQVKLPKNIALHGVSGTVWQANIEQIQTDKITIHDIKARLNFWSLITLNPSAEIKLGDPMKYGPVGFLTINKTGDMFSITDADITIAANEVVQNLNLPLPVTVMGDVNLTVNKFTLGSPLCSELSAIIHWPLAEAKALDESVELGDLKAKLGCEQGAVALTMDENNDLGLSYTAYMRNTKRITGDGYIKPAANFPEKLTPLLSFLGKPDSEGRYRLSF
ncbi:MAG: type II secretion system protein N [Thalassotalea sp.]